MSLDERYGCSVSLSPLFRGKPLPAAQCMLLQPAYSGPLFYASRSWSPTAPIPLGLQIVNRWRAVAPEDFATPGIDRVRQRRATVGLQIPLERQYGDLTLASAHSCEMAFDIVALQFLKIDALRAEYQNPLMEGRRK